MNDTALVIFADSFDPSSKEIIALNGVGSHGEPVLEFSVYDAIKAGFRHIVLLIPKEQSAAYRSAIAHRLSKQTDLILLPLQESTADTLASLQDTLGNRPAAWIEAGVYYGAEAFVSMHQALCRKEAPSLILDPAGSTSFFLGTEGLPLLRTEDISLHCAVKAYAEDTEKHTVLPSTGKWIPVLADRKSAITSHIAKKKKSGEYPDVLFR